MIVIPMLVDHRAARETRRGRRGTKLSHTAMTAKIPKKNISRIVESSMNN
jgi:hypothetical protein